MALRRRRSEVFKPDERLNSPSTDSNRPNRRLLNFFFKYSWKLSFLMLFASRVFSARFNLIHDCDEVFNYWEPLHYLLYGNGLQTWEYSAEFGLRSYLYLLIHASFIRPFLFVFGNEQGKVWAFYWLRFGLGLGSVCAETYFVHSISKTVGKKVAFYTLLLLSFSSGCVFSTTTFLPSTFSMYGLTLGASLLLTNQNHASVFCMAVFVLLGWPFSVLSCSSFVLYAFLSSGFPSIFIYGTSASLITAAASFMADSFYYGKPTLSILNLVMYNVVYGESTLYGIEGPYFYFKNAFLNFNFAFLFALLLLPFLLLPLSLLVQQRRKLFLVFLISSPFYIWFGFMSLQPHKEERFLYVIYPILCFSCAAFLKLFPLLLLHLRMVSKKTFLYRRVKFARSVILWVIIVISLSRTTALLTFYSAPMNIFKFLPHQHISNSNLNLNSIQKHHSVGKSNIVSVCIGSEWHRFPSSFFLPSPNFRLFFLNDGFDGLLPFYFNESSSFSAATTLSPPHFNDKNKAHPHQFIKNEEECNFLIELDLPSPGFVIRSKRMENWRLLHEMQFLDSQKSPSLFRAFFIPFLSKRKNKFGWYRLFQKAKP